MPFDIGQPLETVTVPAPVKAPVPDDGLNRENIRRVRDVIAKLPAERFDMRYLIGRGDRDMWAFDGVRPQCLEQECGTAACIAGWALATLDPGGTYGDQDSNAAGDLFGLSEDQRDELFTPSGFLEAGRYTQAQAVAVLDHLIAAGKVDWSVAERVAA